MQYALVTTFFPSTSASTPMVAGSCTGCGLQANTRLDSNSTPNPQPHLLLHCTLGKTDEWRSYYSERAPFLYMSVGINTFACNLSYCFKTVAGEIASLLSMLA